MKEELPTEDYTVEIGKARIHREGKARLGDHLRGDGLCGRRKQRRFWPRKASSWRSWICARCCRWTTRRSRATVEKTNRVIILHEDTKTGGIAGEIAAIINEEAFDALDAPITRITALDSPVPFSPPLEKAFLPKVEDVVREARRLMAY